MGKSSGETIAMRGTTAVEKEVREPVLSPVNRVSELLFGLFMALTFVGAVSVAEAGHDEIRAMFAAALGCNLAWGLVDAVMYLVRTVTDRGKSLTLLRSVRAKAGYCAGSGAPAVGRAGRGPDRTGRYRPHVADPFGWAEAMSMTEGWSGHAMALNGEGAIGRTWAARIGWVVAAFAFAGNAAAAEFGSKGGPPPANIDTITEFLRQDPYDLELLISFGTSKGGSAGHLALAINGPAPGDDVVYSANFYADRDPDHEAHYYTDDLMLRIPRMEYLFGTTSSLDAKASFGLDFGEIYKRSVIGVRVSGVPATEKAALAAFFRRINDDYHGRVKRTEYHDREIRYDYLRLNCAKTIGMGFKLAAGYEDLEVTRAKLLSGRRLVAALNANIPTEMAMKLLKAWNARGYGLDVVFYRKYEGSTYVDPHEEEKVAFKDLPDRFPSVLSRDFRNERDHYEDFGNLYAIYLLYNLSKYSVRVNGATKLLEIEKTRTPMAYPEAAALADRSAESDSENIRRGLPFRRRGTEIGQPSGNAQLYDFSAEGTR